MENGILRRLIDSVLSQAFQSLDIIVIDDGSTDTSAKVVSRYGCDVWYIYQPNQGAGAARNKGVNLSTADYVAFLDQDDLWTQHKLARQVDAFQQYPRLDMVFGLVEQFYSPDWVDSFRLRLYCPETPVRGYLPSAMMIKRESLLRVEPFGTQWHVGEWADWYLRAVDEGLVSLVLPDVVARRRLHPLNQGLTSRASVQEYARIVAASLQRRRKRQSA